MYAHESRYYISPKLNMYVHERMIPIYIISAIRKLGSIAAGLQHSGQPLNMVLLDRFINTRIKNQMMEIAKSLLNSCENHPS
jgi:hypothetical protein